VLYGALGAESEAGPTVLHEPIALDDGDAFLLCTDGFWGRIDPVRIEERLRFSTNVDQWLEAMRREVAEGVRDGDDNYSAVGVWIGSPEEVTVSKSTRAGAKRIAS
jgi:serine/threonine protein phosphatase PrpC